MINQDFENEINNCKIQIKKLEEEETILLNQLEQNKEKINNLNEKIVGYKNKINNQKEQIKKLDKDKENLERNLKNNNNIIQIGINNSIYANNLNNLNKIDFTNFYDMIIVINSIKDINKG